MVARQIIIMSNEVCLCMWLKKWNLWFRVQQSKHCIPRPLPSYPVNPFLARSKRPVVNGFLLLASLGVLIKIETIRSEDEDTIEIVGEVSEAVFSHARVPVRTCRTTRCRVGRSDACSSLYSIAPLSLEETERRLSTLFVCLGYNICTKSLWTLEN